MWLPRPGVMVDTVRVGRYRWRQKERNRFNGYDPNLDDLTSALLRSERRNAPGLRQLFEASLPSSYRSVFAAVDRPTSVTVYIASVSEWAENAAKIPRWLKVMSDRWPRQGWRRRWTSGDNRRTYTTSSSGVVFVVIILDTYIHIL